jgi:tetratricopeptide (TPR) repeat protein
MTDRAGLLNRAANCYFSAGYIDDACRCFEQSGNVTQAARLHEQQGRQEEAARLYHAARAWTDAARCYQNCDQTETAADCLEQAGDRLGAAWLLADRMRYQERVRVLLAGIDTVATTAVPGCELVAARCELAAGYALAAAAHLHRAIAALGARPLNPDRPRLESWAFTLAESLRRPDLIATLHAAAVLAGTQGAERRWERWALATLGDATGIPLAPDETAALSDLS